MSVVGQILRRAGWSTATYPATAGSSSTILKSDGTNFVGSTETYATPGTSGNVLTSDGTNWTSAAPTGGWTRLSVTSSDFTTSSTSLVTITGLSFTGVASTNYEIECTLLASSSDTSGIKFGFNSSGGSPTYNAVFLGQTSTTTAQISATSSSAAESQVWSTASNLVVVKIWAIIGGGTGTPTIAIQGLKVSAGTLTVKVGSVMRYRILGQ